MRRTSIIPALFLVLVVCLVAVGFYRGWFAVSSSQDVDSDKVHVNLTVNPDQVKSDTRHAAEETKEKASELSTKVKQEAKALSNKTKTN